ncbi:MAG: protein phosphatase 2C domain-containing protein [Nostoc sp.]
MARQLSFLFFLIASILLVFFVKTLLFLLLITCILLVFFAIFFAKVLKAKRKNLLEIDIADDESRSVEKEVFIYDKVASQEIETGLDQELLANEQTSAELEQLRTVGDHKFRIRSFHIQKKGLSEAECEDKNALSSNNSSTLRVAIADGATESLFSDVWADILVNSYVSKGADLLKPSGLEFVNQEFVQKTSQHILQMPETRQWFMYEKLERGTHATLAAVEFSSMETIQILTVGDSCIFWCDGNADEVNMLPELSAEDFGSFPASVCHIPKTWQSLEQKIVKKEVTFQNTLQMVLCTDALACWLVTELQSKPSSLERLFQISDSGSFTSFIETLREQNNIRNDDVTLVLIDVLPLNV